MKVKITEISKNDSQYPDRQRFIGQTGDFIYMSDNKLVEGFMHLGWRPDDESLRKLFENGVVRFFAVKMEEANG